MIYTHRKRPSNYIILTREKKKCNERLSRSFFRTGTETDPVWNEFGTSLLEVMFASFDLISQIFVQIECSSQAVPCKKVWKEPYR